MATTSTSAQTAGEAGVVHSGTRAMGITTEQIRTTSLDAVQQDAVGILSPEQTGIVRDFWGDSDPRTIARLIAPYFPEALPEITAFWQRITLSEINPPSRGNGAGDVLLARIDHLLSAGALDQAEALIDRAGVGTPDIFGRAFGVGLLAGRAQSACAELLANPSLSPDISSRIFCLAREGDWSAAALTLTTAKALGQIDDQERDLLARFLDPELFEDTPPPPPPTTLTPLSFIMREALALPRNGQSLPLAFLHIDLNSQTGWRNQVIATEKLVRSHAIPPQALISLYQEGESAASGGVWVRVDAVQNLIAAIENNDSDEISAALNTAYTEMAKADLLFVLAELAADELRDAELTPQAAANRFRLWLLTTDYRELAFEYEAQSREDSFLMAMALGEPLDALAKTDIELAIAAAFQGSQLTNSMIWDATQGRLGEAVLKSFSTLIKSRHSDPVAVETTLAILMIAGLEDEARRIGFQIVLNQAGRI